MLARVVISGVSFGQMKIDRVLRVGDRVLHLAQAHTVMELWIEHGQLVVELEPDSLEAPARLNDSHDPCHYDDNGNPFHLGDL